MNKSNKVLAPIIIAGITIGFLASAYKFVFKKPKKQQPKQQTKQQSLEKNITPISADQVDAAP